MKYVVLARDKETDMIVDSFGCFRRKANAVSRKFGLVQDDSVEYCIEEVDPCGSFADDECEDEEE